MWGKSLGSQERPGADEQEAGDQARASYPRRREGCGLVPKSRGKPSQVSGRGVTWSLWPLRTWRQKRNVARMGPAFLLQPLYGDTFPVWEGHASLQLLAGFAGVEERKTWEGFPLSEKASDLSNLRLLLWSVKCFSCKSFLKFTEQRSSVSETVGSGWFRGGQSGLPPAAVRHPSPSLAASTLLRGHGRHGGLVPSSQRTRMAQAVPLSFTRAHTDWLCVN